MEADLHHSIAATSVKMLRKKIEDDPAHPEYILTEPLIGYRFRNPSDPDLPTPETKKLMS